MPQDDELALAEKDDRISSPDKRMAKCREQIVVHADADSSRKRDVGRGVLAAGVFPAQQHTDKSVDVPEEVGVQHRSHEKRIHRGVAGVAGVAGFEGILVIGAVGGEAEESAPIAGYRDVDALQSVARLVDLVEAGVAVAGKNLIFVSGYRLLGGRLSDDERG